MLPLNKKNIFKNLIQNLITGLLALLPIAIAIFIISVIYGLLTDLFSIISDSRNSAILLSLIMVSLASIIFIGKKIRSNRRLSLVPLIEKWIYTFPLIGKIVSIIRELVDMVKGEGKFRSLGVALVPFGGARIYALITNEEIINGVVQYTVFIVQGTFPPTGLVCYYSEDDIQIVNNMTAADVFQLQITLGVKSDK